MSNAEKFALDEAIKDGFNNVFAECRSRLKHGNRLLSEFEVAQTGKEDKWPVFVEINAPGRVGNWIYPATLRRISTADWDNYNVTWRAWLAPPTDAERAKSAWYTLPVKDANTEESVCQE